MVNRRRTVQEAHERSQVGLFLEEINRRCRSSYKVVGEPLGQRWLRSRASQGVVEVVERRGPRGQA